MLDRTATEIFAKRGIMLVETKARDYAWTHDVYLVSEPPVKDLEVRIHEGDYMGKIVYRETIPQVHYLNASREADRILKQFKARRAN